MTDRDRSRLDDVASVLVAAYEAIDGAMAALGWPVFVVYGLRTDAEQRALWLKGREVPPLDPPRKTVTDCDGDLKRSKHQRGPGGFARAIDFAFIDDPRTPKDETWDPGMPWDLVGLMAERLGLRWGGRWALHDLGHIELKD